MRLSNLTSFFRNFVGLDQLQNLAETGLQGNRGEKSYSPLNIEQIGDDSYRITMTIAGFGLSDLDVATKENTLVFIGNLTEKDTHTYIHRGIAGRAFERRFELAEYIKVSGANIGSGLLQVELSRNSPVEKKAQKININDNSLVHFKAA